MYIQSLTRCSIEKHRSNVFVSTSPWYIVILKREHFSLKAAESSLEFAEYRSSSKGIRGILWISGESNNFLRETLFRVLSIVESNNKLALTNHEQLASSSASP
jgi:hypothetical protein